MQVITRIVYLSRAGRRVSAYLKVRCRDFASAVKALSENPYSRKDMPYQAIIRVEVLDGDEGPEKGKRLIYENKHFKL